MRQLSAVEAASELWADDDLGVPLGPGQPSALLHALGTRDDWTNLTIHGALLVDLYEVMTKPGVSYRSGFFGPAERFLRDSGADVCFVPSDFRRFETVGRRVAPRVVATAAAMPRDGAVSLSLHAGATVDELLRAGADPARLLIVEVNPGLPHTLGLEPDHPHRIPLELVDVLVESDREVFVLDEPEPSIVERAIAAHVAEFVRDGCTVQTGIGGVPSTVVRILAESDIGDLGVHSEMFTTGLMHLHRAGKVTNARKGTFEGFSVATFAAGTRELYDWLEDNEDVRFLPVGAVNDPDAIARNRDMVTINAALSVDLAGQVCADAIGGRQFSGIGGHEDFVAGASIGLDDRSLICLPSTVTRGGVTTSRIVGALAEGAVVTTPRHCVDVIVTEHGAAELSGRSTRERADALITVAAEEFRDELRETLERDLAYLR